jgi:hypothetical protein
VDNQRTRVSYREGQRLRADDLTAEQDYLVELERRHNLAQHAPGIVSGFAISGASIGGGIAVDEDGRVLTVEESVSHPDETPHAWIVLCESCVGARKDRRRELARVVSGEQPGALYVDALSRRYTSLSASQADDPAGRAAMQVGPRGARDRNAFVVTARNRGGMLTPRIALEVQGNNRFIGDVIAAAYPRDTGELVPSVIIEAWPNPVAANVTAPTRDLSGLGFEAMSALPPDPSMPGIYAIGTGTPAEPIEQLRIDLGKQVDGDLSTRFSIGARDAAGQPFREWLQVNGKGDLMLSDVPDPANAPVSIEVSGTIERGPIKPDLADPKFTALLKLAWLAGLRQSIQANTHVTLTVDAPPPAAVETEQTWSFGIAVHQQTGGPITVDAVTAILTHTDLDDVTTVQPITTSVNALVAHEGTKSITVTHPGGFVNAGRFSIRAQVNGKIGSGAWWNELNVAADIPIIEKPVFEVALNPPDAQPNTQFDESVRVVNNAVIQLKIVLIAIGALIQGTGVQVLPGQDQTFTEQNLLLPLPVTVTYVWDGFPEVRMFTTTPVLTMEASLSMNMRAAGTDTEPLVFDVAFRNSTAGDLRVLSVSHRIVTEGAEAQPSTKQFKRTVKPGRRTTIGNLSVAPPAAPAANAKLEVEIEIESGGQRHIVKKEFDLS